MDMISIDDIIDNLDACIYIVLVPHQFVIHSSLKLSKTELYFLDEIEKSNQFFKKSSHQMVSKDLVLRECDSGLYFDGFDYGFGGTVVLNGCKLNEGDDA